MMQNFPASTRHAVYRPTEIDAEPAVGDQLVNRDSNRSETKGVPS